MFVAVDDHAELRTPITDMVIRDRCVTCEVQDLRNGISDHGAADVAYVHGLGDIRR